MVSKTKSIVIKDVRDLCKALTGEDVRDYWRVKKTIERHLYKNTDCGAWIQFQSNYIQLGSIVEGSEAEVRADDMYFPFTMKQFSDALDFIEEEASRLWHGANEEGEN